MSTDGALHSKWLLPMAAAVVIVLCGTCGNIGTLDLETIEERPWLSAASLGLKTIGLIVPTVGLLFAFYTAEQRAKRAEQRQRQVEAKAAADAGKAEAVAAIKEMLGEIFRRESIQRYRANLMLLDHGRLKVSWCTPNMLSYPDCDKSPTVGWGVAGTVLKRATIAGTGASYSPMYASGRQLTPRALRRQWGFTNKDIDDTKHLLWILSAPVYVDLGSGDIEVFGVLNIDGVEAPLRDPTLPYSRRALGVIARMSYAVGSIVRRAGLVQEPMRPK